MLELVFISITKGMTQSRLFGQDYAMILVYLNLKKSMLVETYIFKKDTSVFVNSRRFWLNTILVT